MRSETMLLVQQTCGRPVTWDRVRVLFWNMLWSVQTRLV